MGAAEEKFVRCAVPVAEAKLKLGKLKETFVLCTVEPLYDWSGRTLSGQEFQMLRHYQITFWHLVTVFDDFCSHSSTATESGEVAVQLFSREMSARL